MDLKKSIAEIEVERPDDLRLDGMVVKEAIDARFWHHMAKSEYWANPHGADAQTKARWTVNYIRHELTNYDPDLYRSDEVEYSEYKAAVLDAISEKYPFLSDECERQKEGPY